MDLVPSSLDLHIEIVNNNRLLIIYITFTVILITTSIVNNSATLQIFDFVIIN